MRFAFEREKKKKREKTRNKNFPPASYEFINSDNKDSGDLASVIHVSISVLGWSKNNRACLWNFAI